MSGLRLPKARDGTQKTFQSCVSEGMVNRMPWESEWGNSRLLYGEEMRWVEWTSSRPRACLNLND